MKIGVTGAGGFIGSHLTEALIARGHEVTCLVRSPRRIHWVRNLPVRVAFGDVCTGQGLTGFVRDQEVVIHNAGVTKAADMETYHNTNVGGTAALLSAITSANNRLRRFVLISSQEAMGPSPGGEALGEDAPQAPLSMYGKSKLLAERTLRDSLDTIPMTVIRPPSVYGPRDRDIFAYFRLAALGITPILGYHVTLSVVYVKNLVYGIALAVENPFGSFRSYFFTDGPSITMPQFSELIGTAFGKRQLKIPIPRFAVRSVGNLSGLYTGLTHRPLLLSRDKIEAMMYENWIISDQRARAELGYRPAYSTAQGIAESAHWYKEQRWL